MNCEASLSSRSYCLTMFLYPGHLSQRLEAIVPEMEVGTAHDDLTSCPCVKILRVPSLTGLCSHCEALGFIFPWCFVDFS